MSLRRINEAFRAQYESVLTEEKESEFIQALRRQLVLTAMNVVASGRTIKDLEIELQGVIKEFFPENQWWQVTTCNIFVRLLEGVSPRAIVEEIIEGIKPEFLEEV